MRRTISVPSRRTCRRSPSANTTRTGPASSTTAAGAGAGVPVLMMAASRSVTVQHLTSVQRDDRPGEERGERAQQQGDPPGDLVGRADPAQRYLVGQPAVGLVQVGGPGRVDRR